MATFETIPAQFLQKASITLTDAQIKALPTTGIELVAAQGNGTMIIPAFATGNFDRTADYSTIDGTAKIVIVYSSLDGKILSFLEESVSGVSDLLAAGEDKFAIFSQPWALSNAQISPNIILPVDGNNLPLIIKATNGALGDFTGGNAANTLKVTVYYVVVDL